jgi:C4-dicarboxylate transporter DctM subunit
MASIMKVNGVIASIDLAASPNLIGSAPFVVTMLVMIALLSYWPDLALWLPRAAAS